MYILAKNIFCVLITEQEKYENYPDFRFQKSFFAGS